MNDFFLFFAECALLLLAHNAPVKIKNAQGWSPLAEAISYGDRQMSESVCQAFTIPFADVLIVILMWHSRYHAFILAPPLVRWGL